MQRKLTITVSEAVYAGLYRVAGAGKISQFIESAVKPHLASADLSAAYAAMAADEAREAEALEWSEGLVGDSNIEAR